MQQTSSSISINSNSNDSNKRNTQKMKQLQSLITLPQHEIEALFNHKQTNKFIEKVIELNSAAIQRIQIQQFDEALLYLIEAQRLLQKAGQRQRQVQKKLVIFTLHNIACCYQKNWELEKCSNYLQALIYNLNSVLNHTFVGENNSGSSVVVNNSNSVMKMTSQSMFSSPKAVNPKIANLMLNIQARFMLGRYYLQFCAVNSQINNHSGALIAARKSIQTMKKMFQQLLYFIKNFNTRMPFIGQSHHQQKQRQQRQQFQQKTRLIHQVSKLADNINISQYDMILQTTRYYLRRWQSLEQKQSMFSRLNVQLEQKFRNFSIGSIAQIDALIYQDIFLTTQGQKARLLSTQSIMQKVLVMIIGYFTISTQLRLLSGGQNPISQLSQNNNSKIQNNKNEQQTRQAEIYHLFSIILTAIFIPFDILYMKHILLSYRNHYRNDLFMIDNLKENDQRFYQEFLFTISEIKKGSLLGLQCEDSIYRDQRRTNDFFAQGKKYSYIKGSIIEKQLKSGFNNNQQKNKMKDRKTKSKSKSKSKKSTLKTISALSAQSKTKQKIDTLNSKSPQIHTRPSLSKGKNQKSSLKSNNKITSLQYIFEETKKKQKSKQATRKHEYAGIKPIETKKKRNYVNNIEQTNAYFLKKIPMLKVKSQSKSKSKDSKIKTSGLKGLTPNNPTQLYYHKQQSNMRGSKSKSKQKSLRKTSQLAPKITITPVNPTNTLPTAPQNSKRSLYMHYS